MNKKTERWTDLTSYYYVNMLTTNQTTDFYIFLCANYLLLHFLDRPQVNFFHARRKIPFSRCLDMRGIFHCMWTKRSYKVAQITFMMVYTCAGRDESRSVFSWICSLKLKIFLFSFVCMKLLGVHVVCEVKLTRVTISHYQLGNNHGAI